MYLAVGQNESRSFLSVAETVRAYFYMDALKDVAKQGFDYLEDENTTDALVETNKVNAGAATEQARIAAEAAALTP